MPDVHSLLRARGIQPVVIERTEPQPGDRYFVGHRVVQLPGTKRVEPSYHDDPYLASQKRLPAWASVIMGAPLATLLLALSLGR